MGSALFVSGASGQLGRRVVEHLLAAGEAVIAGTRSPEKLADLAARGVEVRRLDFGDPASIAPAFAGVERALIISTDGIGTRAALQIAAVAGAAEAGVRHLVYTSVVSADVDGMALADEHRATELAIAARFASYTILRNSLYAELVLGSVEAARATGSLFTARGAGRVAWVSREDCARAAAAALTDGFEGTRVLDVTGPEALSGDDVAAQLAELLGAPVAHVSLAPAAFVAGLVAAGVPQPYAEVFLAFDQSAQAGLLAQVSPAVEDLTGAPGRALRAVLAESGAFG